MRIHRCNLPSTPTHAHPKLNLIDALHTADAEATFDRQYEVEGGTGHTTLRPLDELKRVRDAKLDRLPPSASSNGYQRPARLHRGMAHSCNNFHSKLDFYGKMWVRGTNKATKLANADRLSYALEMRHFERPHCEMSQELKRVFAPVMNDESLAAVYNTVICMHSVNNECVQPCMACTHADIESTQPCMVGRRLSMLSPTMLVSPSMTLWAAQMHNAISSTDVSPYDMMVELPI